jgi:hypothetical protein
VAEIEYLLDLLQVICPCFDRIMLGTWICQSCGNDFFSFQNLTIVIVFHPHVFLFVYFAAQIFNTSTLPEVDVAI